MKTFTVKQAVTGSIVLYVVGFTTVVGIGFMTSEPAAPINTATGTSIAQSSGTPSTSSAGKVTKVGQKGQTGTTQPAAAPVPAPVPPPVAKPNPVVAPPAPSPQPTPTPQPPPPPPTPPPAVLACGSGGPCSAAQIATHNSQSDCWVIYNSKAYNITSFIPNHPGVQAVYNDTTCGHDIKPFLTGQAAGRPGGRKHVHSSEAYTTLLSYYVGDIQ